MGLQVAIIADDLTGALDCSSPFAERGLRVVAAIRPTALGAALQLDPDVLVVSTASRAMSSQQAETAVREVAMRIAEAAPQAIAFKKIDSRLKGHVAIEVAVTAEAFSRTQILACPAVPDQSRPVIGGKVMGRGLTSPLHVADRLPEGARVADARHHLDLSPVLANVIWQDTLVVGARGVGQALAQAIGSNTAPRPFASSRRTLFIVGSRDEITSDQIERLAETDRVALAMTRPDGGLDDEPRALPALVRATDIPSDPILVVQRLAAAAQRLLDALRPDTLVLSGGDTALAVLEALGVELIETRGEALPGLPWFEPTRPDGSTLCCVVKSGGFGDASALMDLLPV